MMGGMFGMGGFFPQSQNQGNFGNPMMGGMGMFGMGIGGFPQAQAQGNPANPQANDSDPIFNTANMMVGNVFAMAEQQREYIENLPPEEREALIKQRTEEKERRKEQVLEKKEEDLRKRQQELERKEQELRKKRTTKLPAI